MLVKAVVGEMVKAVILRVAVMGDFAEGNDFVAQFLQKRGQLAQVGVGLGVVCFCTVTGRIQPGQQGCPARGTGRRVHERLLEQQACRCQTRHVRGSHVPCTVGGAVDRSVIVRQEDDQIRLGSCRRGTHYEGEDRDGGRVGNETRVDHAATIFRDSGSSAGTCRHKSHGRCAPPLALDPVIGCLAVEPEVFFLLLAALAGEVLLDDADHLAVGT